MVDILTNKEGMVDRLSEICRTELSKISFALAMEGKEGEISYHVRSRQPCYGELRKYSDDGVEVTGGPNNDVKKPDDLHYPFPEGRPVGLCVYWGDWTRGDSSEEEYFRYALSSESPWRRGLIGPENIEVLRSDTKIIGMVLKNLEIDPTVLVHFLILTSSLFHWSSKPLKFQSILDAGATPFEAMMISLVFDDVEGHGITPFDDYVVNIRIDPRRVLEGDPHDLTGGLLSDRFDYNRPRLADIFKGSVNFCKELKPFFPQKPWVNCYGYTYEEVLPKFKEVLYRCLDD